MQRNMIWLFVLGMVASVVLTATDADAAWRRRAWRRGYNGACCSTASYGGCCDAGYSSQQQYGQPYQQGDMQPPPAPAEPQGEQNTPPAPSAQ